MNELFWLLILFQVKHLLCDYFLQTPYMLKKFLPGWGFLFPLLLHSSMHGVGTLIICLCYNPSLWWLALVDLVIHFGMDRLKAGPKYLGRFKALSANEFRETINDMHMIGKDNSKYEYVIWNSKRKIKHNTYFWWSLGFDALIHHCTHYFIIYCLWMLNF